MEKDNSVTKVIVDAITPDDKEREVRDLGKAIGLFDIYIDHPHQLAGYIWDLGYRLPTKPSTAREADVKSILEHYFSEQLGEGAADDITGEILSLWPKGLTLISWERIRMAMEEHESTRDNMFGLEAIAQAQLEHDQATVKE